MVVGHFRGLEALGKPGPYESHSWAGGLECQGESPSRISRGVKKLTRLPSDITYGKQIKLLLRKSFGQTRKDITFLTSSQSCLLSKAKELARRSSTKSPRKLTPKADAATSKVAEMSRISRFMKQ
jgi:hypothetical protein